MKRGFEIHMGLGGYKDRTVWGDVYIRLTIYISLPQKSR